MKGLSYLRGKLVQQTCSDSISWHHTSMNLGNVPGKNRKIDAKLLCLEHLGILTLHANSQATVKSWASFSLFFCWWQIFLSHWSTRNKSNCGSLSQKWLVTFWNLVNLVFFMYWSLMGLKDHHAIVIMPCGLMSRLEWEWWAFITSYSYLEVEVSIMSLSSSYFQHPDWCWYLVAAQSNICWMSKSGVN